MRCETVVVGAGVVGLSVAFELIERGRSVVLVDAGEPASGASGASAGMLAPGFEVENESEEFFAFARRSAELLPGFVSRVESRAGRSCGYRASGGLAVAFDRDQWADLELTAAKLERFGVVVDRWDVERLRQEEPHLSPRAQGALHVAGEAQIDAAAFCTSLVTALESSGAVLERGLRISAVDAGGDGRLTLRGRRTPGGPPATIVADQVVLALGADVVSGPELPIADLGVRAVKGQILRTRGPRLLSRFVRTPEVYLVPRGDGELWLGATMEEVEFDERTTVGAMLELLRPAWEALPGIDDHEFVEAHVGFRGVTEDQRPLLGESELPGLYLALGFFRNGFLCAPLAARTIADKICGAADDGATAFSPLRRLAGRRS